MQAHESAELHLLHFNTQKAVKRLKVYNPDD